MTAVSLREWKMEIIPTPLKSLMYHLQMNHFKYMVRTANAQYCNFTQYVWLMKSDTSKIKPVSLPTDIAPALVSTETDKMWVFNLSTYFSLMQLFYGLYFMCMFW